MEMVRYKSIALALSATALTLGAWLYQPSAMRAASPFQSAAPSASTDWSVYNGGVDGDHYSPLTQITPANVLSLIHI